MTGDQRTIQQWTVRIGGIDQKTVKPGDSIEIGRKPLRPLPDDGTERLEIADGTRSMSKRHATFAVSQNGGGTVRDLGSTNGTYVEGHQVPAATLLDGNTITIGRTRILFWASSREQE